MWKGSRLHRYDGSPLSPPSSWKLLRRLFNFFARCPPQVPQDDWGGYPGDGKDDEIPCRRMRSSSYVKAMGDEESGDSDTSPKASPQKSVRPDALVKSVIRPRDLLDTQRYNTSSFTLKMLPFFLFSSAFNRMSLCVFALPFVQMAQSKGPPHLRDYIIIVTSSDDVVRSICAGISPLILSLPPQEHWFLCDQQGWHKDGH